MQVIHGFSEIKTVFPLPVLTIGNFDGIHLGHRQIIESVVARARRIKGTSIVYTFRPHPHLALTPDEKLQLINTYDEKLDLLREMGVDVVVEEPFSREFSTIRPENFFKEVLVKRLSVQALYVGYDFGFGKNREGNLEMLKSFCKDSGIELIVTPPLKIQSKAGDEICSSSRIRSYIQTGNVKSAAKLLGRTFFYRGLVVRGHGRGQKIGFATANVKTDGKLRVLEGVYATKIRLIDPKRDVNKVYLSVTNVGRQPTFGTSEQVTVETHILDFNDDLYGEMVEVQMIDHLRAEMKFENVEKLVAQIKADIQIARSILSEF